MKSTGVVRRIDELGRIVIPKEIRRTLGIKAGEQVEILKDDDLIVLKKYSSFSNFLELSNIIVDTINCVFGVNILITDRDKIVAISNKNRSNLFNKKISSFLEKTMCDRKRIIENSFVEVEFGKDIFERYSYVISPINVNSDIIGLVIIFSEKNQVNEKEEKLVELVTKFFCKIVEE